MKNYFGARQATGDNTMRLMRFAFRVTKATSTQSEYVIFLAFHGKNNYANAFKCCVICTPLHCPVKLSSISQLRRIFSHILVTDIAIFSLSQSLLNDAFKFTPLEKCYFLHLRTAYSERICCTGIHTMQWNVYHFDFWTQIELKLCQQHRCLDTANCAILASYLWFNNLFVLQF